MEKMELTGISVDLDGNNVTVIDGEGALAVSCSGDACGDIDYIFQDSTNSYHFYNDGNRRILLKVTKGTVLGCGPTKTRRMRPGEDWDSGYYGICGYEANYR